MRSRHGFPAHLATGALLLATSAATALAQSEPKTMRLEGAPSQTGTGALRCVPDESVQLGLRAFDESLSRVLVADYAPLARSTDERVVVARVTSNAASTVNVLCVGDGEAWITVEAAGLRADMPVLVGTARRKATPKGPHPELGAVAVTGGAPSPVVQTVAASAAQPPAAVTPTAATAATAAGPVVASAAAPTTLVSQPAVQPAAAPTSNPADAPVRTSPSGARQGLVPTTRAGAPAPSGRELSPVAGDAALAAPTGVTAAYVGDGRVAVGWSAVPGAALYSVLYRDRWANDWYAATRQPVAATEFVSDPVNELMVPAGAIEFVVVPQRDAQDWSGARSMPAAVNVPRYSGRYRVTVNGFRVLHETLDTPLNGDGQHDEVYVRVAYREYDADGNAVGAEGHARTHTHGDVNAPRWKQPGSDAFRFAAGSASSLGGLVTGNGYPSQQSPWIAPPALSHETFPLLVWEGFLMEGQHSVAIVPAIYEDDENGWEVQPEMKALLDMGTWVGARAYKEVQSNVGPVSKRIVQRPKLVVQYAQRIRQLAGMVAGLEANAMFGAAPVLRAGSKGLVDYWSNKVAQARQATPGLLANLTAGASLLLNTKDRPIGMTGIAGGQIQFDPQVLNLSFETAEQIVTTKADPNSNVPAGIVALRYTDTVPGGSGDYILYLQVTRLP